MRKDQRECVLGTASYDIGYLPYFQVTLEGREYCKPSQHNVNSKKWKLQILNRSKMSPFLSREPLKPSPPLHLEAAMDLWDDKSNQQCTLESSCRVSVHAFYSSSDVLRRLSEHFEELGRKPLNASSRRRWSWN